MGFSLCPFTPKQRGDIQSAPSHFSFMSVCEAASTSVPPQQSTWASHYGPAYSITRPIQTPVSHITLAPRQFPFNLAKPFIRKLTLKHFEVIHIFTTFWIVLHCKMYSQSKTSFTPNTCKSLWCWSARTDFKKRAFCTYRCGWESQEIYIFYNVRLSSQWTDRQSWRTASMRMPWLRDCRCFQVFHTDSCHVLLHAAVRILGCSSVSRHQPPRLFKSLCYRHNSPAPMRQGGSFGEKGELSELIACCVCGSGRGGLLASSQLRAFNPVTVVGWPTRIISRNYRLRELSTAA